MADPIAQPAPDKKALAIKAWHDADTDDKRRAAVQQFPELVGMYALAAKFVSKP